jgi:hypothetical protein
MMIQLTSNEAWKILDAITAYKKDYAVSGAVEKTFGNIEKKLREILNEKN